MEKEETMIKDLEVKLMNSELEKEALILINAKLGYSTKLLTEFHLSYNDKLQIAEAIDSAQTFDEVKEVYDHYFAAINNTALDESLSDFQWSPEFKENLRGYFTVALGTDFIADISDNLQPISAYFALENKIRNTPDAGQRKPMTDKLMQDRKLTVEAMNNIIDIVNSFNKEEDS